MKLRNGGIIGPENIPSGQSASGMWTLANASEYIKDDLWPIVAALYNFTSFTFTNGTQTGSEGPSLQNLLDAYDTNENPWLNNTEFFNTDNGIQLWTVPADGTYRIEAWGAQGGGSNGGLGARMRGDFSLTEGEIIRVLVGQRGNNGTAGDQNSQGGGGGSFVVRTPFNNNGSILVIAGGGGGSQGTFSAVRNAPTTQSANSGAGSSGGASGGTNGNGGSAIRRAGGGGGFFTNGQSSTQTSSNAQGGFAFVNGGSGGNPDDAGGRGGFGGGAATWETGWRGSGGGGGYSGGGGAYQTANTTNHSGGGGGSFNSGTNQDNESGAHVGHGKVEITFLG